MKTSEKLNLLADRLENEVPDEEFDLSIIDCGTAACVYGWSRRWRMNVFNDLPQKESKDICLISHYEIPSLNAAILKLRAYAGKYQDQEIEEQHNSNQQEKQNERDTRHIQEVGSTIR